MVVYFVWSQNFSGLSIPSFSYFAKMSTRENTFEALVKDTVLIIVF